MWRSWSKFSFVECEFWLSKFVECEYGNLLKPVIILVQYNSLMSKNYIAHSITVVCVIGWIWEKNRFVCTLWLSVHMNSVVEQRFFSPLSLFMKLTICRTTHLYRCNSMLQWRVLLLPLRSQLLKSQHGKKPTISIWLIIKVCWRIIWAGSLYPVVQLFAATCGAQIKLIAHC